ncbi:OmpA family protein [Candidatus Poribacteria bacterium]|nr:OmpA family protein [Candidatus Poribacteria bacterium]
MATYFRYPLSGIFIFLIVILVLAGCATRGAMEVDAGTASNSVVEARNSIAIAQEQNASEYAPEQMERANNLVEVAQEVLRKGNNQKAMEMAYMANLEALISIAIAGKIKAERRIMEAQGGISEIMWAMRGDELALAETKLKIAEEKARLAEKSAQEAMKKAEQDIQHAKTELEISKAELEIRLADEVKASRYAQQPYDAAVASLNIAKSELDEGNFDKALEASMEASRNAANAVVQARARLEAESEESLRGRDRAASSITKAELILEQAKGVLADENSSMFQQAEKLINEAKIALDAKRYDRAESLADEARISASSNLIVAQKKDRENREREALEDIRANALDAIAKAERNISQAQSEGAEEVAGEIYYKAFEALDNARKALQQEDFEKAVSISRESSAYAVTAIKMVEAKNEQDRKIAEIENDIIQNAQNIPESSIRRTEAGVVISMGGNLFSQGSSRIREDIKDRMKSLADILRKYPQIKLIIEGHTDSQGSDESNLKISTERAHNFLRYLVDQENIPLKNLSSVGYGETRPIASNINEEGRRQNRRVDVVFLTKALDP